MTGTDKLAPLVIGKSQKAVEVWADSIFERSLRKPDRVEFANPNSLQIFVFVLAFLSISSSTFILKSMV